MRKPLVILFLFMIAIPIFAGDKNKDWSTAKLLELKTQDMQSSQYGNPNAAGGQGRAPVGPGDTTRGPLGGSFSSAPVHFVVYNIAIETTDEIILAKLTREASSRPPDLKADTEIKWKSGGPKFVQIMDEKGKKFDFEIVKRQKKSEQEKKN